MPTKNKLPPPNLLNWLFNNLKNQSLKPIQIVADEGGELGRSTEFLKLLTNHDISLETTEANASFHNLNEHQYRTLTNMVKDNFTLGTYQMNIGVLHYSIRPV